jgi:hypothetical protein
MLNSIKNSFLGAISSLALIATVAANGSAEPKPPIEIPLELKSDSYVTLVVEDDKGNRVRNLVSETFYKAGKHTVYWDGMDDHGRANIGPHGNYTTTGAIVTPGKYKVRGITRDKIDLAYEFTPYSPSEQSWRTSDARGQWLADHTPPSSVLYVPGKEPFMLMGSSLAEGAHGLVWTDVEGKKTRGVQGIGGGWAGAVRLTLDKAGQPSDFIAFGLGASRHGEISLVGIGDKGNKTFFSRKEEIKHIKSHYIVSYPVGGLAVYKGLAAISYPKKNEIAFIKIDPTKTLKEPSFTLSVTKPKGLTFDDKGRLLILEGNQLNRYQIADNQLADKEVLIGEGLDDPKEIIVADGKIFISDHGNSHQVKVFDGEGSALYAIGKSGKPACGSYNEKKMHYPMGMTLTPSGELWVAEEDYQPKRVSVWTKDGEFKKAFYGSTEYGGGGKIDPLDKTRFYYFGMEFKLDWEKGTDKITNIFYRRDNPKNIHFSNYHGDLAGNPETPIYINGRQYMTNTYTGYPTMGPVTASIWLMEDGVAKPVAAIGQANFESFLKTEAYKDKIPAGHDITVPINMQWKYDRIAPYENAVIYAWSDLNNDEEIQVDEVQFKAGKVGGLNQDEQLNFYTADALKIAVSQFNSQGVPLYDLKSSERISPLGIPILYTVLIPGSNGDVAFSGFTELEPNGKCYGSVSGINHDGRRWYYPNQWAGLHASQSYPINRKPKPGDIIGTTKVISPTFNVADGKEELWALNANSGQIYLFTVDGFFVASLFKHGYFAKPNPLKVKRGMPMNNYTSDGEGFWQTITASNDGNVYVQAMNHTSSIMRLDGINSIKRLDDRTINVSKKQLDDCLNWFSVAEMARQAEMGKKTAKVAVSSQAPIVDGDLSDWIGADWLEIDDRTWGAFKIANGKLYAAWKTHHKNLIKNSGADPWQGMFKTGGALDIMISNTGHSSRGPKPGDQRFLISEVNGTTRAIHYEQKSERKGHPGEIASPNRTVKFDYIANVSDKVQLAKGRAKIPYYTNSAVYGTKIQMRNGETYEISIPLDLIGLNPKEEKITGDIGALIGNGATTIKRLFWSNKNTVMLFDAPEESLLKPSLWGKLKLVQHIEKRFNQSILDRGDEVNVLSQGIGILNIDSKKVKQSKPSAVIEWSGKGELLQRRIGRNGYIIFRNQAKGWFDDVPPLVNLNEGFDFTPHKPGRFKDGLYAGCRSKTLTMFIDKNDCGQPKKIFGGALWAKQKKDQSASWDIVVPDDKIHQLTTLHETGAMKLTLAPLNNPDHKRTLVEFDGSEGMSVVQFSFKGSVRLSLEQPGYTAEDIKNNRKPANIIAIFVD